MTLQSISAVVSTIRAGVILSILLIACTACRIPDPMPPPPQVSTDDAEEGDQTGNPTQSEAGEQTDQRADSPSAENDTENGAEPHQDPEPPEARGWKQTTIIEGLEHPWGLAFLPGGDNPGPDMLITERPGRLRLVRGGKLVEEPIEGVPEVFAEGQGGLLDVALHPRFEENSLVYLTHSTGSSDANRITLSRGRLENLRLHDVEQLFQARPSKSGGAHFGSRLLWMPDGTLLMSIGDGGNPPLEIDGILARDHAQRLSSHLGSIVRLNEDGGAPEDNPFRAEQGALPEIYTYGHRNVQGLTIDPKTGMVWASEHGPYGGDELNLIRGGENYGWPEATFGRDYRTRRRFTPHTTLPDTVSPQVVWTPAQAPSGLAFYTGDRLPDWQGSLFSGGLAGQEVRRMILDVGRVVGQESLPIGARVRDVVSGPDGYLYLLTDERNGRLLRIEP